MNFKRHITGVIKEYSKDFPAVLLTGLRQVGKSYVFNNEFSNIDYYTLDDLIFANSIKNDARGTLESLGVPIILDEIQKAQDVFPTLKLLIDRNRKNGMYFLTGSQKFVLMQKISESLAGRIGIINLMGLSNREINSDDFNDIFVPSKKYFEKRKCTNKLKIKDIWDRIYRGSFPEVYANSTINLNHFFSSFVETYVERDVRLLSQIDDYDSFVRLIQILATRIGQIINVASISREIGIDVRTINKYVSILEASNVIYFIKSFSTNLNTRVIKSPKLYFTDTGLAAYLTKWPTSVVLENGSMAGNFYENYIINEIVKSYFNRGIEPSLFYYRDVKDKEIDLIICETYKGKNILHPLEIKHTSSPNIKDIKHFSALNEIKNVIIGEGGIICNYDNILKLDEKNYIIPWYYI